MSLLIDHHIALGRTTIPLGDDRMSWFADVMGGSRRPSTFAEDGAVFSFQRILFVTVKAHPGCILRWSHVLELAIKEIGISDVDKSTESQPHITFGKAPITPNHRIKRDCVIVPRQGRRKAKSTFHTRDQSQTPCLILPTSHTARISTLPLRMGQGPCNIRIGTFAKQNAKAHVVVLFVGWNRVLQDIPGPLDRHGAKADRGSEDSFPHHWYFAQLLQGRLRQVVGTVSPQSVPTHQTPVTISNPVLALTIRVPTSPSSMVDALGGCDGLNNQTTIRNPMYPD